MLFLQTSLLALGVVVVWFVIALGVALFVGKSIRLADEAERVSGEGEPVLFGDFGGGLNDVGKSISGESE